MDLILNKLFNNALAATNVILGVAKKIDYKRLSRYILEINKMNNLDSMLHEVSGCLKDILNYRLFAFTVQDGDKVDLWIDPSIYKKPLWKIVEKDFGFPKEFNTHHLNEDEEKIKNIVTFKSSDLMSFVLMDDKYFAKLYVLPARRMFQYHGEIITIIVNTLGNTLSNFMNIKHLRSAAAFDPLTNCYNRREFNRLIEHNIANAHRYGKDLSIMMLDLDYFKRINDTYGHQAGDTVLKEISQSILYEIRKGDYLSRYGGEEFVLVLPDTKLARAMELAERLRKIIDNFNINISDGKNINVSASFGVAALKKDSDKESLLREADEMLYMAKANGRNKVMPGLKLCVAPGEQ